MSDAHCICFMLHAISKHDTKQRAVLSACYRLRTLSCERVEMPSSKEEKFVFFRDFLVVSFYVLGTSAPVYQCR